MKKLLGTGCLLGIMLLISSPVWGQESSFGWETGDFPQDGTGEIYQGDGPNAPDEGDHEHEEHQGPNEEG